MDLDLCVLLAEDDPDEAFLIQRAFNERGFTHPPRIVGDGAEAISYLLGEGPCADRRQYPFPNLIILDLKMPRLDGFEVLQWLLEHPEYRVIPTIVWSSSSDVRDVKRAYCLGANGYLCKPNDYVQFKGMVSRLLAHWDDCLKPPLHAAPACEDLKQAHPFAGAHKPS